MSTPDTPTGFDHSAVNAVLARKPGLVLTKQGPVGVLDQYQAIYHDGVKEEDDGPIQTGNDARKVLAHFLGLFAVAGKPRPEWVTGSGATRSAARACGLKFRERVPGAGRPATGRTTVPLHAWVTPEALAKIQAAAKAFHRSIGEEIASRF